MKVLHPSRFSNPCAHFGDAPILIPMRLSREHVEEYRAIHKKEFNEELPFEEAEKIANDLVELYNVA
jgi:hypothetical protein